jgi:alkylation response protein AidB-like acyl-CoA dehydrogenase
VSETAQVNAFIDIDPADREPSLDEFRQIVRDFISENLPADWKGVGALEGEERIAFVNGWRDLTTHARLLTSYWPYEYGGRGLSKLYHLSVAQEFAKNKLPLGRPSDTIAIKLLGNTVNAWGTHEQKLEYLPRILSGVDVWAQGYSEPGSGSDLASLRTKAVLRDGQWHIDGQKIWTSNAMNCNKAFMLVRTDPTAPNSKAITMLLIDMHQPGVEVRPILNGAGSAELCEVFLTDAVTDEANVLGEIGNGWAVTNSLLTSERGEEAATNPVLFAQEFERVIALAREVGADRNPGTRARIARSYKELAVMKAMGDRILSGYVRDGSLGPQASISKLYWSEYHKRIAELGVDLLGIDALTWEGEGPMRWFRTDEPGARNSSTSWLAVFLANAMSGTIYAGTSEVQRNIISERALGMPREPKAPAK